MQNLFVFYVDQRKVCSFKSIESNFDKKLILDSCPQVELYMPESHVLHKYGSFIRNIGLRTSFIIETNSDEEAVLLRLIADDIPLNSEVQLQMVVRGANWEKLREISDPLWENRMTDLKRRNDRHVMHTLQRQAERIRSTLIDLDHMVDVAYIQATNEFLDRMYLEIDRISDELENQNRMAAIARRKLIKLIKTYQVLK